MKKNNLLIKTILLFISFPLLILAQGILPESCCTHNKKSGEKILICKPEQWNGDLIVYAHGYVAPQKELELPLDELTFNAGTDDEIFVPDVLIGLGYAFATSSFSANGYAVKEGAYSINALVKAFKNNNPDTDHVLVVGGSEGGLIATMLVEKHPEVYDGGLALCGPLGGMPYQIQYLTDFRVVFNYFFDVFYFGATEVPPRAWWYWGIHKRAIEGYINADPDSTDQLFDVVGVARGPAEEDIVEAAQDILGYNIRGFNDLKIKAGGIPYDNRWQWYRGSDDDLDLNWKVERVQGDCQAKRYVKKYYKPTGNLQKPLVTLHTTKDPIVPYRHELFYSFQTHVKGNDGNLVTLPAFAYGHCNFTAAQVMSSFGILVWMSTDKLPSGFINYLESMQ